eukprot:TRINITY_DN4477_c0_g1_i1.p4 TRINITY_DN4477_c0_g1~~TRINITY_DN4477_c0_g1_i1.p4  ORF type:complete len:55 (-),score=17.76 TRINITY_DN4477_c0_g1_i1:27-191(-)
MKKVASACECSQACATFPHWTFNEDAGKCECMDGAVKSMKKAKKEKVPTAWPLV